MTASAARAPFTRHHQRRDAPVRGLGGLYRTDAAAALGGIPLDSAESAMVAAVRMAYRVADAQVTRSARLARRLREAGDRAAGPHSDRQAVDAAEHLVLRATLGAVSWLEGAAADPAHPLQRLLAAEYRLLGNLFGLGRASARTPHDHASGETADARAGSPADAPWDPPPPAHPPPPQPAAIRIRLLGACKRAVQIHRCDMPAAHPLAAAPIDFYNAAQPATGPLSGTLSIDTNGVATLAVTMQPQTATGRWKAAVCDDDLQIGVIEIDV